MPDATAGIVPLWNVLRQVDFFGTGGMPMPAATDSLNRALQDGAPLLPRCYADAYVAPVQAGLPRLFGLRQSGQIHPGSVEMVTGAIYQHAADFPLAVPLRRFTAVISDLYQSFLADTRRAALGIAVSETLPPLAMFQHDGSDGPLTIEVDLIDRVLGGKCGVVSLPATYAEHPVLWAALAHETGGHDVTHADAGLLDQLATGLGAVLTEAAGPLNSAQLSALWSYWIDEASADVYGLLNIGPGFADNMAVFLAAMNGGTAPALRMESRSDPADASAMLDPHPTDILRLHLALGAIDALAGLSPATRATHAARIEALAAGLAGGDTITLAGNVRDASGQQQMSQATAPLAPMQQAARAVGNYIASASLPALAGRSIQAIETWDDADEALAQRARAALAAGQPIIGMGDAAQLLAAANLAAFDDATRYAAITAALNEALDASFRNDPVWGLPAVDHLYIRYGR